MNFRVSFTCGDPPKRPKLMQPVFTDQGAPPMSLRAFTATLSPVVPADNVTERQFHQFDNASPPNETVFLLDPSAAEYSGTIDDAASPGSCFLVDVNASGPSAASASVPLVPPIVPPPPPPTGVPTTPTITGITFAPTGGPRVVDTRR